MYIYVYMYMYISYVYMLFASNTRRCCYATATEPCIQEGFIRLRLVRDIGRLAVEQEGIAGLRALSQLEAHLRPPGQQHVTTIGVYRGHL